MDRAQPESIQQYVCGVAEGQNYRECNTASQCLDHALRQVMVLAHAARN